MQRCRFPRAQHVISDVGQRPKVVPRDVRKNAPSAESVPLAVTMYAQM